MSATAVRAVVFDVGNTLWFEATSPERASIERKQAQRVRPLLAAWGVELPVPLELVLREVWDAFAVAEDIELGRGTQREPSLPFIIRGALASHGVEVSDEQAAAWWRVGWISEREFGVQLYPDTLDVLRDVKQAGLLIGINTNRPCTADMHLQGLRDMGIARYVDAAVCSGNTGLMKPHRSTFDLVLGKLGVAAADAVMVGDGARNDMAGAKAVGMTTVWKLNGRHDLPPCPDADYAIHDLAELLALPLFERGVGPIA